MAKLDAAGRREGRLPDADDAERGRRRRRSSRRSRRSSRRSSARPRTTSATRPRTARRRSRTGRPRPTWSSCWAARTARTASAWPSWRRQHGQAGVPDRRRRATSATSGSRRGRHGAGHGRGQRPEETVQECVDHLRTRFGATVESGRCGRSTSASRCRGSCGCWGTEVDHADAKVAIRSADHGQWVSVRVAETAEYDEGYKYELIDGRLYVSPESPDPRESPGDVAVPQAVGVADATRT